MNECQIRCVKVKHVVQLTALIFHTGFSIAHIFQFKN